MASWLTLYQSSLVLVLLAFAYSYLTARATSTDSTNSKGRRPTEVRSWIPWFGHALSLLRDPDRFLSRISQQPSASGIFSLQSLGSRWIIIARPSLFTALLQQPSSTIDSAPVLWSLLLRAFGASKTQHSTFNLIHADLPKTTPLQTSLQFATTTQIQSQLPNLITFSEAPIDQHLWERLSNTDFLDPETVSTSLFALLQNFVNTITLTALLGTDFLIISPSLPSDLSSFSPAIPYLLLGFPRWLPVPVIARAAAARRRLDNAIDSFHRALDAVAAGSSPEDPWRDLGDVSKVMKERSSIYRKVGAPPALKGPLDLYFIWCITSTISPLVFRLLIRILSTPTLSTTILSEITASVKVSQPPRNFGIAEPPSLELDVQTLQTSAPMMLASFHECIRLDTSEIFIQKISRDCTITDEQERTPNNDQPAQYALQSGDYIAIPRSLSYHNPRVYDDPQTFRPSRFSASKPQNSESPTSPPSAKLSPWLDTQTTFLSEDFIQSTVLAFVAGTLALWDFEPLEAGRWEVPEHCASPNFGEPKGDIKVKVRRRVQGR